MSRSKRKHPKFKCADSISNKRAKSKANRKFRRINKIILQKGEDFFKLIREVSNVWADFPSDGLADHYLPNASKKDMSK